MDVNGITWVGNIYQKFEALCLEVEEIMYQDTVDFVENRVQTVGASVKKFYSGVVHDLLPPSPDDSGKKETDVTDFHEFKDDEIITKPRVHIKRETLKREINQVRKRSKILGHVERKKVDNVFPVSAFQNQTSSKLSSRQFNDGTMLKENKYCDSENRVLQNRQPSEIAQQPLTAIKKEKHESSVPQSQTSIETTEVCSIEKSMDAAENISEALADPSWDLPTPTQDADICLDNGKVSAVETIGLTESGQVDSSDMISTDSSSFSVQKEEAKIAGSDLEKLEESCIFVDRDELSFIALSKGKRKPYKKKLRDAFSPRKRSSRAQEYKQIAVKYSGDTQSNQERAPEGSSRFQQVCESEWELL